MEKFALSWDERRPLLIEVLGPGTWSDEEHHAYLVLLASSLMDAPAGGFDLLSDCLEYTMQVDAEADHEAYDMLAGAGCRRMVMVVTKLSIAMQTQRMIRESSVGQSIEFTHVTTMPEADVVIEGWQRG
jgi:hypothetical protein